MKPETRSRMDIMFGMVLGVILGFLLAVCVIDDLDRFTIPLTDKVFVRER